MLGKSQSFSKNTTTTEKITILLVIAFFVMLILNYLLNSVIGNNDYAAKKHDVEVQYHALEYYFAINKYYPTSGDYHDQDWRKSNLNNYEENQNSYHSEIKYSPKNSKGEDCEDDQKQCSNFQLETSLGADNYVLKS